MSIKIFHTGDNHLGMNFNSYGDGIKETLAEARYLALENMINKSNELNTDLFVVAGDLFNSITVLKRDIKRTVEILNKFNGACVLVLPGNHDYDIGGTELWDDFSKSANEKILLINEKKVYDLKDYNLDVLIYAGPCDSKHSKENSIGWIKEIDITDDTKYHIGIAHGAIEGLSADIEGNYFYMGMDELNNIPVDLWLLGHTHVSYPEADIIQNNKIFNPGSPEPDGLDFNGAGSAWLIDLDKKGNKAEKIETGSYRFYDKDFSINHDEKLDEIKAWVLEGNPNKKIVRLNLKGSLSEEVYDELNVYYRDLESSLFHLIIRDDDLKIKINKEIIEKEFTVGSFPYEFLGNLSHDQEALQIAYDLVRRK